MAAGTLYTYPENWRAFKAQIAAQYSGARLKVASNSPAFTFGQTNRTLAFLNNFPLGKVRVSTTGMFQRLDKLRKNAFGSVLLFGTKNNSTISGVWVFRGQELVFPLSPDWQIDYESYDWRKLDPSSEECKTMVKEYFAWEGDFKHVGKAFNQGKVFK
ncbi:elongation factor 1-gamma-like [Notothenia coriiceps]|uniref:Elongation factor 1-gamma-like n=1 Tax=Notothenia coriiceps TaxID=8208 RepID=A0A6I9MW81_9TELE|nr:PREDICTED: elongation factor 1-gamma-like [Notothenia coriiceps]